MATDDDQPDYPRMVADLAVRKGFTFHRGSMDKSPFTLHFKDRETEQLVFSSPSFEHAYGHLQRFPDRPSPP